MVQLRDSVFSFLFSLISFFFFQFVLLIPGGLIDYPILPAAAYDLLVCTLLLYHAAINGRTVSPKDVIGCVCTNETITVASPFLHHLERECPTKCQMNAEKVRFR